MVSHRYYTTIYHVVGCAALVLLMSLDICILPEPTILLDLPGRKSILYAAIEMLASRNGGSQTWIVTAALRATARPRTAFPILKFFCTKTAAPRSARYLRLAAHPLQRDCTTTAAASRSSRSRRASPCRRLSPQPLTWAWMVRAALTRAA